MLTPDYLESVADDAVKLYAELENRIIKDVARRIITAGVMTETARHQIKVMQQSGELYDEIINEIASITKVSKQTIKGIFEDASIETLKYDDGVYKAAGLNPIPLQQSPNLLQTLTAGLNKTQKNIANLIMTTATNTSIQFVSAVNNAYLQVTSGAFDYNTAIFNAIEELSNGLSVTYESGKTDKIDVAVRRAVLTGVNQTACTIQENRMDEMECDLVETSAHAGARVTKKQDWTNHAWWQGKVYSRSGTHPKYPDFKKTTGYGKIDGLGGANCRHNFYPFYEGISKRNYTDKELEEINNRKVIYNGKEYGEYEALQMQRKQERNIRKLKRELAGYEEIKLNGTNETQINQADVKFNQKAYELKQKEKELRSFIEQTGLKRDRARERVAGFDRGFNNRVIKASDDFSNIEKSDIIEIPDIINKTINKQNQTLHPKTEIFISNNLKDEDIVEKSNCRVPFSYSKNDDKIIVDTKHSNIEFYQIDEAISHEIIHMKDVRNSITVENYEVLKEKVDRAKLYIDNNYNYFYDLVENNSDNMALSDILSAITKGKLQGDFGRSNKNYWNEDLIVIQEISANILSSDLVDNKIVEKLLEQIPPLKDMKGELKRLYELEIK